MGYIRNAPDDTPTDGPMIVAVASVLTAVSLGFLCLRYYVRIYLIHALGADDWFALGTWLLTCAFTIISAIQTSWGLGIKHIDDIPPQNIYTYQLLEYAGAPFVLGFKLTLLLGYFRFVHKGMCKYGVSCVLVSCTLFHLATLVVQLKLSQPVVKEFDPRIVPFYTASSSLTIVFDFAVMFLPFPVLIKTKIPTRKKVVLLGLFALGFFITVIQIIRIQSVRSLTNPLDSGDLILWSTVETNLGIICACIPVLSPLVRKRQNKSNKVTHESSWGDSTAPTAARQSWRIVKEHNLSLDDLYDTEEHNIGGAMKTGSRDSMLGNNQIRMETDIVVTNDIAPVHFAGHHGIEPVRTRMGDTERWLNSAHVPVDYNMSSRSYIQV
ncbi:hypothetical protein F4820DRAFT_239760 [Hypoxylon rubiginosum]|uniref:Uncharacterized protein n=1 Tax=Hypoxylon rubiginosum TaxID=110542 RepID=A0ACB9Z4J7_9PEZI|nr:hypothetical protein F4820DRAFT_239760 [Hypoxylon rubiginosum]